MICYHCGRSMILTRHGWVCPEYFIRVPRAEYERLRKDATRYRWLRDRINFRDQFVRSEDGHGISTKWRTWVHDDYRENPPMSEHIDEYIDAALTASEVSAVKESP